MKIRKQIVSRFREFQKKGRAHISTEKSDKPNLFDVEFEGKVILRMNADELKAVGIVVAK